MRIEVIQLKRGDKATLEAVLRGERKPADGEPIFEIDTGKLKFGDGQQDYIDLGYFGADDIEITGSLDGQILIYNKALDKWEPKNLADNQSIEYTQDGLRIAGFGTDKQGASPVVNVVNDKGEIKGEIVWKQAITDETLDAKVNIANEAAYSAGQSAANALRDAGLAKQYAEQAEQFRDLTAQLLGDKFWFGTRAEYETEIIGQNQLKEGMIYFIRDYDWDNFPNPGSR